MGTATVIGRDELGRIIDVQVTTEEDIAPPGPEVVTASGGVVEQVVLSRTVTLTDAQIKDASSIELVPAPGEGLALQYVTGVVIARIVTGYTNIDENALIDFTEGTVRPSARLIEADVTNLLSFDAFNAAAWMPPEGRDLAVASTNRGRQFELFDIENQAIYFHLSNGSRGDLTGGNAANTLKVVIWYGIIEV